MAETREYVRQSESMHPNAVDFHVFVHQQASAGKAVDRVSARRWVMSAYKRESLIRFGAKRISSDALRLEQREQRSTRKESLTASAIGFTRNGVSISESEAESFYSVGITVVMQRLSSARSQTYVYDKSSGVFTPVGLTVAPKGRRNNGAVKAIFDVLSARHATASEIAAEHNVKVDSVRSILSRFCVQGRVTKVAKARPGSGELIWGLVAASNAPCS